MWYFRLSNLITLIAILLLGLIATSGAAVAPRATTDGLCAKYVVQTGESCAMIAKANSITVADIETYNAQTWGWPGCQNILQGASICISSGDPLMPITLPDAICGPQVPGTKRPNNWSDLGSLNPCADNECCSSWGFCGSTPEFCTSKAATTTSRKTTKAAPKATSTTTTSKKDTTTTSKKATTTTTKKATTTTKKATTTTKKDTTTNKPTSATKSSQKKTSTTTSKAPVVSTWTIKMYSEMDCHGDHYILEGHNMDMVDYKCLNLHGNLSTKNSITDVSCNWYTLGGTFKSSCIAGTLTEPQSWIVDGGICTIWENRDCKDVYRHSGYLSRECRNRRESNITDWTSMKCYIPTGFNYNPDPPKQVGL
ncbi:uncharacterized protein N7479_003240 [Penicillium vulpinum]|uniref:LysM domain-containing protein n=1 Tax=Penicillium vulpinum TaxID=29845 RepID=A0A1V6S460_9EURO|nr:uncharacterized protein N7479_003240 [Penicillium vulpinum]KAJ5963364.1 hypothetical protein N7479_003240 [Penicillium vulpinum]OQE08520.1 hypothetical protein PENVUL_c009G08307 [Penicillium vulpinum]